MNLYVYKGNDHKGTDGEALLKKALRDYSNNKYKEPIIARGEYGKPYFENIPIYFSISHTCDIWTCLMADFKVGIDIQISKNLDYEKIAKRFFSKEEAIFVRENGKKSFFEIWTRKEAFVKYTGKGFSNQRFSGFSVVTEKDKKQCLKERLDEVFFEKTDIILENDYKDENIFVAMCIKEKEPLLIKNF